MGSIDYLEYIPRSLLNSDSTTNVYKLWKLYALQFDEIFAQIELLKPLLSIAEQSGNNLDAIGKLLNCTRAGGTTDAAYRVKLYTAIASKSSGGSIPDILAIINIIKNGESWGVAQITEVAPAGIQVYTNMADLLTDSFAILKAAKAAGVNLLSVSFGDNPFGFDGIVSSEDDSDTLGFAEYPTSDDSNAGNLSEGYQ